MDYSALLRRSWELVWNNKFMFVLGFLAALIVLPQLFNSILAISILNQMAIAIVFALAYKFDHGVVHLRLLQLHEHVRI